MNRGWSGEIVEVKYNQIYKINSSRVTYHESPITSFEEGMKTHKDLYVWKEAVCLTEKDYSITAKFPKSEICGLTSQIRRAVVSIPSNIAEGAARQSNKEFIQFLYIALGSCAELDTQLILAEKLSFSIDSLDYLKKDLERIMQMINGLIRNLKGRDS